MGTHVGKRAAPRVPKCKECGSLHLVPIGKSLKHLAMPAVRVKCPDCKAEYDSTSEAMVKLWETK